MNAQEFFVRVTNTFTPIKYWLMTKLEYARNVELAFAF